MKKLLSLLLVLTLAATILVAPTFAEGGKQVIVTSIQDDPEEMDPTRNSYARSSRVLQNLFVGLYKLDADGVTYVPALAEGVEISDDNLTYTFTLKDGLKWSDGSPLTAYDYEYSWIRTLDPESRTNSDLWVIKNGEKYSNGEVGADQVGVKALDDKTFQVELEALTPWFLSLTATTAFFPVCKANCEANEKWTADVSTYVSDGPFMLQEYSSLNRLVLVKNPNYYDADKVQIDEVQFVVIADSTAALTAYNNNEINVNSDLSADALTQYQGSDEFSTKGRIGIQYCDFQCLLPEFSDKRVRQAFAMAIDRQTMLTAMGVIEPPVFGFVPYSQMSLTDPGKTYREVAGDMFTEDVAAAQQLMADAGYPNGEGFPTVELVCKNDTQQKLMMQILGEFWKSNLGVNYEIKTLESSVYWDELAQGNFSVDRNGFTCDYMDPSAHLKIFTDGSNASENQWDDPVFTQMYRDSLQLTDPAEREAAIIELEKYLTDEMPGFPVYSYELQYLVKPNVKGVIANAIGHFFFEYATVE